MAWPLSNDNANATLPEVPNGALKDQIVDDFLPRKACGAAEFEVQGDPKTAAHVEAEQVGAEEEHEGAADREDDARRLRDGEVDEWRRERRDRGVARAPLPLCRADAHQRHCDHDHGCVRHDGKGSEILNPVFLL